MTHDGNKARSGPRRGRTPEEGDSTRVLGVLGSLIWDRIVRPGEAGEPMEGWGGISYSLEALDIALPPAWNVAPLVKVGEERADAALDYLLGIPRVEEGPGLQVVPGAGHAVELTYKNEAHREERLSGELHPWSWEEMEPVLARVDAVYINFITGFEMDLDTALRLKDRLAIPLYADLHSLFLGISSRGHRYPRPLPRWREWTQAFDGIQVNESELDLLGAESVHAWTAAETVLGSQLKLIVATLGSSGSRYLAHPAFRAHPLAWPGLRGVNGTSQNPRSGVVPPSSPPDSGGPIAHSGDPTGCGDVWGATFFARLLAGDSLEVAMGTANLRGSGNVAFRGAQGLGRFLAGRP